MSVNQAIAFYEECQARGAITKAQREAILQEFIDNGNCRRVWKTDRTVEQFKDDMRKNFNVVEPEDL